MDTTWPSRSASPWTATGSSSVAKTDTLRREERAKGLAFAPADLRQVDDALLDQKPWPLGLGEPRQIVEQPGQPERLGVHRLEVGRLVGEHAVLGSLDSREERGHGRAELVSEVGHARLADLLLVLERLSEAVQGVADGTHLRVAAGLDSRPQVAFLDPLCSVPDPAKRARQASRREGTRAGGPPGRMPLRRRDAGG